MTSIHAECVPTRRRSATRRHASALLALVAASWAACLPDLSGAASRRLEDIPGFDRWKVVQDNRGELVKGGRVDDVVWLEDGVRFRRGGELLRFDFATGEIVPAPPAGGDEQARPSSWRPPRPARGRQAGVARSPDGVWEAVCENHNVVLRRVDGSESRAVTTVGERKFGYGRASWVYGEELDQDTAMWWSPDSTLLAFYEFNDRDVPDFELAVGLTDLRPRLAVESYPKAGDPNPVAGLLVHHLPTGELVRIDVGPNPEQYVYDVRFSPDGSSLLFNRTNRRQNVLELVAADPRTGQSRVLLKESQSTWQANRPLMRWLSDGQRFIWESERTGARQYELRDKEGRLLHQITSGSHPALSLVHVDEERGELWYTAASGENPMSAQLHRAKLDGSGSVRLTQDELNHTRIEVAPDGSRFICTSEAADTPPVTALCDADGQVQAILAQSDAARLKELGLQTPELFRFKAADGETDLWGILYRPSDFDPSRQYPLVVDVYGGPGVRAVRNVWSGPRPECELGFLLVQLENRGIPGRTKDFESATYLKLGQVDLDDQAAGVRALGERPYVDLDRVGITGVSYGGYLSALALLRHPELFSAAVAVSAVTDWRHYDSIYTERYMRLPDENPEGYDAGSCVKLADRLRGRLMLMHGMADDNVHPNNVWQLVHALQQANLPFEMAFFPEADHGIGGAAARGVRWGFLWEALVAPEAKAWAGPSDEPSSGESARDARRRGGAAVPATSP